MSGERAASPERPAKEHGEYGLLLDAAWLREMADEANLTEKQSADLLYIGTRLTQIEAFLRASPERPSPPEPIYVTFGWTERGSSVHASRGYNGPVIARLQWERRLIHAEEVEIAAAIRAANV